MLKRAFLVVREWETSEEHKETGERREGWKDISTK